MKLEKERKEIDFIIKSETWTEKDLADFRKLMGEIKHKNKLKEVLAVKNSVHKNQIRKVAYLYKLSPKNLFYVENQIWNL